MPLICAEVHTVSQLRTGAGHAWVRTVKGDASFKILPRIDRGQGILGGISRTTTTTNPTLCSRECTMAHGGPTPGPSQLRCSIPVAQGASVPPPYPNDRRGTTAAHGIARELDVNFHTLCAKSQRCASGKAAVRTAKRGLQCGSQTEPRSFWMNFQTLEPNEARGFSSPAT